jgi:hypothetical protein
VAGHSCSAPHVATPSYSGTFGDIPVVEFVNIAPSNFRLVQRLAYPPKRGTLCRINDDATYLFTTGYIDDWKTYPGVHVPVPLLITTDRETDLVRAATDVLALARMNWNTAFDTTGAPITLRFARQVGGIMAEVGSSGTKPVLQVLHVTSKFRWVARPSKSHSPRLTTFETRAAGVRQLLQNGVRAGGIAARRSRVPSRWEQAF